MSFIPVNNGRTLGVIGFEQLSVSSSVVTLTASVYRTQIGSGENKDRQTARRALITVAGNSVRVRFDGTDPDASTGHLFVAGDTLELTEQVQIQNFKVIRASADATIAVTYFG